MKIKPEDIEFVDKAKSFTSRVGTDAVLLLVGSRAAGFDDSWSDLDMWVVGDKAQLTSDELGQYERGKALFVDRGDYEAHWTFFDKDDLLSILRDYPDEKMWIVLTSKVLFGNQDTASALQHECRHYPRTIVEQKLKWHFGRYWSSLGPLNAGARGRPETGFLIVGMVMEHLCKLCCLAEGKPFPYAKWLVTVAHDTTLGRRVHPFMSRAIFGIDEFLHPPQGKHYKELVPLKELRDTKGVVLATLKELGWSCSWLVNTDEAVAETM